MAAARTIAVNVIGAAVLVGALAVIMATKDTYVGYGLIAVAVFLLASYRLRLKTASGQKSILRVNPRSSGFVIALVASLALLPLLQVDQTYSLYIETRMLVLAVSLLAFSATLGMTGMVDIGIGAYLGTGAYISARLSMSLGLPVPVAVTVAILASLLLGLLLGLIVVRSRGHYFALVTLGLGLVFYHVFVQAEAVTLGVDGIANVPRFSSSIFQAIDAADSTQLIRRDYALDFYTALVIFALVLVFILRLDASQLGRDLRATKDDETAATSVGLDVLRLRVLAYAVSAGIAGLAGAMHAHTVGYIAPGDFGFKQSVFLIAIAVLGGSGSPMASVGAAFGILILEEKLRGFGDLRIILIACSILAIILYRARIRSAGRYETQS
ncbi:MAG: branched-chain amino acid ABC transporter permease [bacterium]